MKCFPWWYLFYEWRRNWKLYSLMSMHNTYYSHKKPLPETILNNIQTCLVCLLSTDLKRFAFIFLHSSNALVLGINVSANSRFYHSICTSWWLQERRERYQKYIHTQRYHIQTGFHRYRYFLGSVKNYTYCRNWSRTLALSHSWGLTQWWRMFSGNQ